MLIRVIAVINCDKQLLTTTQFTQKSFKKFHKNFQEPLLIYYSKLNSFQPCLAFHMHIKQVLTTRVSNINHQNIYLNTRYCAQGNKVDLCHTRPE